MTFLTAGAARVALLCVLVALALGAAACGDSDDGGGSAATGAETSSAEAALGKGTDEQQIVAVFRYLRDRYNVRDAEGYCDKLSKSAKAQIMGTGTALKQPGPCTEVMKHLLALGEELKYKLKPVKVYAVAIDGRKAIVRTSGGIAGKTPKPLAGVKEDGEWKVSDVGGSFGSSGSSSGAQ
jgi:hypothetical protein